MLGKISVTILVFVTSFLLSFGAIFFVKTTTYAETLYTPPIHDPGFSLAPTSQKGKHVIILLEQMEVILKDGTSTIEVMPIISKGKPGSYYETIGGSHVSRYKTPLHFSSIGHVYMPYSVHVFGNYFIHGIPYYPGGEKVSSEYSGGCIRLSDENAKKVYDFVEQGTPVTISQVAETEFTRQTSSEHTFMSQEMTVLMVAIISLETLTQDTAIVGIDGAITTRKKLLPELIHKKDLRVASLYASAFGEKRFVELMNEKALALGLQSTTFTSVTQDAITSKEDLFRLYSYRDYYKSYLLSLQ